jgi:2-polyprenyl-6-methoxyphenol hydroxylase-like FAD-dependent oxidoreductase
MAGVISHVVVAGAGIGGLTLAIALRARGRTVTVLERAHELGPVGAGLGLAPNALKALGRIGLQAAVAAAGERIRRTAIRTSSGRIIGTMDAAELLGESGVAVHRARLHQVLLDALGPGVIHTGTPVVGYEQHEDRVTAVCGDGRRVDGDLLVGADGVHSMLRAQLVGDGEPVYAGYTSWRGVTPAGSVPAPDAVTETWGRGERFGIVSIGFGEIYWFATADTPSGGRDDDVRRELLARFGRWHPPIRAVIDATPASRILRTDICDRPPIDRWHDGRVVLLGDAAHPMTPNMGQGAGMAIEDAVVLDQCLAGGLSLESALQQYEQRRVGRANAVARASRRFGAIAQWRNPVAAAVRNGAFRLMPRSSMIAQARKLAQVDL